MRLDSILNFLTPRYSNKSILVVVFIIVTALIIDTSVIKTYDLIGKQESFGYRIIVFSILIIISIVGQYFVLGFVKQKRVNNIVNPREIHLNTVHKILELVQYSLMALLVFVLVEILLTSYYSTIILNAVTSISYVAATVMLALLSQRFFLWYKSNRNSVVLLYGVASAILAINTGLTFLLVNNAFSSTPKEIGPMMFGTSYLVISGWKNILYNSYFVSSIVSFLVTWIASALLLLHYSYKFGRVKYWIVLASPLVYFLSQFATFFLNIFEPLFQVNPVYYTVLVTLLFTLSKPIGGILFGVAFWTVARSISHSSAVRNYMIISAYGLVLLFVSNQAIVLVTTSYPPFGLAAVSFMGFSSYLVLTGIYSSAISVSLDAVLRKTIRKSVTEHSKFLESIGTSHMERKLQSIVFGIAKKTSDEMVEKSGVETSLTEDEMKQYIEQVVKELGNTPSDHL